MPDEINLSQIGCILSLHINSKTIQSSVDLKNPTKLILQYTISMLAFFLFDYKNIKKIVHIGLGGGSIAKWINKYFPNIYQTIIEINSKIIIIAKTSFFLPKENNKFKIIQKDGFEYIKSIHNTNVILIDAFDGIDIKECFLSEDFLINSKKSLNKNGIFVINLWSKHKNYFQQCKNIEKIFGNNIIQIPVKKNGNIIIIALNYNINNISLNHLKQNAKLLTLKTDINFNKLLTNILLKNKNLFNLNKKI